jgi:hypothetical protein
MSSFTFTASDIEGVYHGEIQGVFSSRERIAASGFGCSCTVADSSVDEVMAGLAFGDAC